MQYIIRKRRNPFLDPTAKPSWAQIVRLGGDAVSIRLQELRQRLSPVESLLEEICYHGDDWGWAPHYRVGELTLCTVHVLPGQLEGTIELESSVAERVVRSRKVGAALRARVRKALRGSFPVRVRIADRVAVRSFAHIVLSKSKSVAPPKTK